MGGLRRCALLRHIPGYQKRTGRVALAARLVQILLCSFVECCLVSAIFTTVTRYAGEELRHLGLLRYRGGFDNE